MSKGEFSLEKPKQTKSINPFSIPAKKATKLKSVRPDNKIQKMAGMSLGAEQRLDWQWFKGQDHPL